MSVLTIAAPNTDRSLLSIDELRSAAGVSDSARDGELTALGNYISATITNACNVARASIGAIPPTLRLEALTESFRLKDYRHEAITVARRPVVSIVSVTERDVVLATTDYELENNLLYRLSGTQRICWPFYSNWQPTHTVISYTAGWETVPDDLKYAAIRFVQTALAVSGRDPMLRSKSTEGVASYSWYQKSSQVPPEVMDILEMGGYVRKWGWLS